MDLELRPELQKFVEEKVRAGEYSSTREVVEAALARLMLDPQPEIDDETLAAIEEGEAQANRGETRPWHEVRAELLARYLPK